MERALGGNPKKIKPAYKCKICGNNWAVDDNTTLPAAKCSCGADGTNMQLVPTKSAPDKKKVANNIFNLSKFSKEKKEKRVGPFLSDEIKMLDKAPVASGKYITRDELRNIGNTSTENVNDYLPSDELSDNNQEIATSADSLGIDD